MKRLPLAKHKNPTFPVPPGFAELVRDSMAQNNQTFQALGDQTGMSPSSLVRFIQGERKLPSDDKLHKLAKALKINETMFLMKAGRISSPKTKSSLSAVQQANEFKGTVTTYLRWLAEQQRTGKSLEEIDQMHLDAMSNVTTLLGQLAKASIEEAKKAKEHKDS
jgi:transcriptional regulator with XRE-family HTH domain